MCYNFDSGDSMKELIKQIIKFGIVGVIATIIDLGIYYVCYHFIGIDYKIANILGFSVSVIFNYLVSVRYVFNVNKDKDPKRNFILFIIFSVIGLLLNELILIICVSKLHLHEMLGKVIATGLVMVYNFITRKKFLE